MKNSLKTLAVWLIIGIIIVMAISTIIENSNTKLSYSDLVEKIEKGQVEKVELEADGYSAVVKLKNDNVEKKVNIPSIDNLMDNLQDTMKSGQVTVVEKSESLWAVFFNIPNTNRTCSYILYILVLHNEWSKQPRWKQNNDFWKKQSKST